MSDRAQGIREVREARERGDADYLMSELTSTNATVRSGAIRALGLVGDTRATRPLLRLLNASDIGTRVQAVKALGRIGGAEASADLHELATSDAPFGLRGEAMLALVRCGDARGAPLIAMLLVDEAHLRSEVSGESLLGASSRSTKRWARRVLRQERATDAVPVLEEGLLGTGPVTRWRLRRLVRHLLST